ncbi:MAG: DUF58 domain-containing protein [Isosphaeraceae bacterium]
MAEPSPNPNADRSSPRTTAPAQAGRPGAALIDPVTLMRIKSLQMRAKVAVEGFVKGIHRSPYHGFSVEFSEYREYSPGDDPRYLDWRLFARSDRYYVKRFEDETNLRCTLVLDASRSMAYGSGPYTKVDYARTVAATVAYFLTTQRDAVGLLTFEDRVTDYLPPRHRPGHLRRLMALLEREPEGKADLAVPLEQIAATVRSARADRPDLRPARPDGAAPHPAGVPPLARARLDRAARCSPAEVDFGFDTPAMFHDMESGREVYVDPDAAREGYLKRFAEHAREVEKACVDLGIEFEAVTTDRALELVLFDMLRARMRRAGRPNRRTAPGRGGGPR